MISFTAWDRDYEQNKQAYDAIFAGAMSVDKTEDVSILEEYIKSYSGRKHAVLVNSATDALYFSLLAAGVGPGDETIVSDFSWISTSSCISMVGATPVFCDINPESKTLDLESVQRMVGPNTKALIYTHLYGSMVEEAFEIEQWCYENGIIFIEDAAQSLGTSLNGRKAGTLGEFSSYSFNVNKVISGVEGGGVFLTDDIEMAKKVRALRRHGRNGSNSESLGYNSVTYLLNSEIIAYRMSRMDEMQKRRNEIAVQFGYEPVEGLEHNFHKYVLDCEDKEDRQFVREMFKQAGVPTAIHYDRPLSEHSMYDTIPHRKDNCINAKHASETVLSIPIHCWMTDEEIETIVDMLEQL